MSDEYTPTEQELIEGSAVSEDEARRAITRIRAEAWEEGHSWGWSDAQEAHDVRQEMDRCDWKPRTPNPYREDKTNDDQ